jgi:hypothetical protein
MYLSREVNNAGIKKAATSFLNQNLSCFGYIFSNFGGSSDSIRLISYSSIIGYLVVIYSPT